MKSEKITLIHISDLHRSKDNPITNESLLTSLIRDMDNYTAQGIHKPDLLIVSGDIVQGSDNIEQASQLLKEQYEEALEFLNALTDELFDGDKSKIVLVPGNHDVCWAESKGSMEKISEEETTDSTGNLKKQILLDSVTIDSTIKWSWSDRSFYKITNKQLYEKRFLYFSEFYNEFYNNQRHYSLQPDEQFDIFDYPDYGITIIGFNSCFHNDHLNRAGSINPQCIAKVGSKIRSYNREGRLILATWHHNTKGTPYQQDYMDDTSLQNFIADNITLGFHGHQHKVELLRIENNIIDNKMMYLLSAGSLCAGPKELPTGFNQQYNLIELTRRDNNTIQIKANSRVKTPQSSFNNPIWEKGIFNSTVSEFTFEINHPKPAIPSLGQVEKLISGGEYPLAKDILYEYNFEDPIVRTLLLECYNRLENYHDILEKFQQPQNTAEMIALLNASLEIGEQETFSKTFSNQSIKNSNDPSVIYLRDQLKGKLR